jgi:hypothetical protein
MYKVTQELIKQRQQFCELPLQHVNVKNLGGGILDDCYGNAYRLKESDRNYFIVSGWVVLPFKEEEALVKVVQHWFNVNLKTKEYIDTSPVEKDIEYVTDMNLYKYCTENDNNLLTHVASSLIYEDERFKLVRQFDKDRQIVSEIEKLTTEKLYEHSKKNNQN